MKRVVVVGLGGIGSLLVEPLARYLNSIDTCKELVLMDGDTYSSSNSDRQRMNEADVGQNKAEVQARLLRPHFTDLSITAKPEFVGPRNAGEILAEEDVVFLCVDNHATRKLVSDQARRLHDVLLISAGNDYTDGNVQIYWKKHGRQHTAPLDKHHEEIRYPRDRNPAELSCEELALLPGGGQVIFANLTAAALALNAFYAVLTDKISYGEVYFDIRTNKAQPAERH
jgi:molybdopterin/thiamine biosynthesis adenylyltransferase